MERESETFVVVSNPNPIPSTPQRKAGDICYRCKRLGHWAMECPNKTPTKSDHSTPPSAPSIDASVLPIIRCPYCQSACSICISKSAKNPDKGYYTCWSCARTKSNAPFTSKRSFFKWCDEVTACTIPKCSCGAGPCSLNRQSNGQHKGDWYFACRVKKNHGACNFFCWADSEIIKMLNRHIDECLILQSNNGLNSINDLGSEMGIVSGLLSSEDFHNLASTTDLHQEKEEVLDQGIVMQEAEACNPVLGGVLQAPPLMSQSEICLWRKGFWKQISSMQYTLTEDVIYQILGLHNRGWFGRLAFPPSRSLKDHRAAPFFCCVFPSFDPITRFEDVNTLDVEGFGCLPHGPSYAESVVTYPQTSEKDVQLSNGVIREPAYLQNASTTSLRTCEQEFLNILETIDQVDCETKLKVAKAIYNALSGLPIDKGPFSEGVKDYCDHLARLSAVEGSKRKGISSQALIKRYNDEKMKYDDVCRVYAEALTAYEASNHQVQSLREEAARIKGMLRQVEQQLCCCEAEKSELQARVAKISSGMLESRQSMDGASKEMEEAVELEREREMTISAAKAALERARAGLQESRVML